MIKFSYSNIHSGELYLKNLKHAQTCAVKMNQEILSNPKYAIFNINQAKEEISYFQKYVDQASRYKNFIVIAMGGALLNPQSLIALSGANNGKNIYFFGNTDPIHFQNLMQSIDLGKSAVIVISNTGNTLETVTLTQMMIQLFKNAENAEIGKHFFFITNTKFGHLQDIALNIRATIIPHKSGISGRFSGLSNVTNFIAQIAGINLNEYLKGAESVLEDFANNEKAPSIIAAAQILSAEKPIMVSLAYLQQFNYFLEWYCQIIAESLGKKNQGITPMRGLGPNDQHSMLQLYIEGKDDKFYNFFNVENLGAFEGNNPDVFSRLKKINDINFEATKDTLQSINRPIRTIMLSDLSVKTIGELTAHMMLEAILLCEMCEVNPFDQPGVELIKIRANKLLLSE